VDDPANGGNGNGVACSAAFTASDGTTIIETADDSLAVTPAGTCPSAFDLVHLPFPIQPGLTVVGAPDRNDDDYGCRKLVGERYIVIDNSLPL
jgi:hypothetical protein